MCRFKILKICIYQVREFLEPSSLGVIPSVSRSSSRQRSGLVTPDSELADEEVDRLGQQASSDGETLGDGERALVNAFCNVRTSCYRRFSLKKMSLTSFLFCVSRWFGGNWKKRHLCNQKRHFDDDLICSNIPSAPRVTFY